MQYLEISNRVNQDSLLIDLWEFGTLGMIEGPTSCQAFFDDAVDLSSLAATYGGSIGTLSPDSPQALNLPLPDPVLAGNRFFIVSPFDTQPTPAGRFRLEIESTYAFGSGRHESTQLAIQALEELVQDGYEILDVGAGTGILSAAAQHLGAKTIFACDIDFQSILISRHLASKSLPFTGSLDSLRSGVADLVIANISRRVIDHLAHDLTRVTRSGGCLILSGFTSDDQPLAFVPDRTLQMNDWLCWVCRPEAAARCSKNAESSLQPFSSDWW